MFNGHEYEKRGLQEFTVMVFISTLRERTHATVMAKLTSEIWWAFHGFCRGLQSPCIWVTQLPSVCMPVPAVQRQLVDGMGGWTNPLQPRRAFYVRVILTASIAGWRDVRNISQPIVQAKLCSPRQAAMWQHLGECCRVTLFPNEGGEARRGPARNEVLAPARQ